MKNYEYNPDDHKFETLGEFKFYLNTGWNLGFEYNGVEYGIEGLARIPVEVDVASEFRYRDRKSTRLNSSHNNQSRMPSSA